MDYQHDRREFTTSSDENIMFLLMGVAETDGPRLYARSMYTFPLQTPKGITLTYHHCVNASILF